MSPRPPRSGRPKSPPKSNSVGLNLLLGALRITELIVRTGVLNSKGLRTVLAIIYPIFFVFRPAGNCAFFTGIKVLTSTLCGGFLIAVKFATLTRAGGLDAFI